MPNNLYFTVGLPRSGKSTQAERWLKFESYIDSGEFHEYNLRKRIGVITAWNDDWKFKEPDLENQTRVVVSGDAIRESLGFLWNPDVEDHVDAIKYTMVKSLLKTGHTVLIDETNTSERSIRKILEIDIGAQVAVVTTTKEECLKRARPELQKPINRMWNNICDLICYDCDYIKNNNQITLKVEYVLSAVERIKRELIQYKEMYTNESVRVTPAEDSKLQKLSSIHQLPGTTKSNSWSYSGTIVPESNFQVY